MTAIVNGGGDPGRVAPVMVSRPSASCRRRSSPGSSVFPPVVTGVVITTIGALPVPGGRAVGHGRRRGGRRGDARTPSSTTCAWPAPPCDHHGAVSRCAAPWSLAAVHPAGHRAGGTLLAVALGMADFSRWATRRFAFPQPFAFGAPTFQPAAIISMTIVVLILNCRPPTSSPVGEIVGTDVDRKRIAGRAAADMVILHLPVFNGFTQSAFARIT
ncbi:solute carrier family 23 protein [Kocuria rhizophila]|nr:solute carrier family 23 protein [Kocuria rhizophila]